jgi:type IV secretion system protein VirD4
MFQIKKTTQQPTKSGTVQPRENKTWEGSPVGANSPFMILWPIFAPGFIMIFLFIAYKRGWLHRIFGLLSFGNKKISSSTEKGSAHFAERGEISKFLKPMTAAQEAGTLLIGKYKEKSLLRLTNKFFVLPRSLTSRHTLIAAPNGAGKSRSLFLPNLSITQKVSFIATDPKSELWELTSGAQLNPIRFAPTDPKHSAPFNWIPLCSNVRTAKRCAEAIINAQATGKADPFWSNAEQNLLTALFVHTAGTETPTPAHAYEILTSGTVSLSNALINSPSDTARRAGRSYTEADTKIQTGVSQGLIGKLQFLDDPDVRRFTSSTKTAFSFQNLRHKPTQIYWCLKQSDVTELQPLTALFFNLAILQLIDEQGETPVNFYFDEFANIGKLNNFEKDITLLRGQNIAVIAGLQSKSQLAAIYNRDNANTIIENFNNKIILPGLQADTAEDFAKMLGKYTFEDIRTSSGTSSSPNSFFNSHSSNESYYTSERQLLTADELRRLPQGNCILISTNIAPVYLETNFFKGEKNEAEISGCSAELATPTYTMTMKPPKAKKAKLEIAEFEDFEADGETFNFKEMEDTSATG